MIEKYTIPLWDRQHSYENLVEQEKEDFQSYKLGYEMKKEVQDPSKSAYKEFSDKRFPLGNVGTPEELPYLTWVLTCDFNRSPHCWALGQLEGNIFNVHYEIVSEDAITREQAEKAIVLLKKLQIKHVELHGDGTGNQGGARYGRSGDSDFSIIRKTLQKNGITYSSRVRKSNPQRAERVKVVNNVIYNGEERRLQIHERCKTVIDDYKYSIVDDSGAKKRDQGDRGHISDCIDYWIYREHRKARIYMIK